MRQGHACLAQNFGQKKLSRHQDVSPVMLQGTDHSIRLVWRGGKRESARRRDSRILANFISSLPDALSLHHARGDCLHLLPISLPAPPSNSLIQRNHTDLSRPLVLKRGPRPSKQPRVHSSLCNSCLNFRLPQTCPFTSARGRPPRNGGYRPHGPSPSSRLAWSQSRECQHRHSASSSKYLANLNRARIFMQTMKMLRR